MISNHDALLSRIASKPSDNTARLLFADVLEEELNKPNYAAFVRTSVAMVNKYKQAQWTWDKLKDAHRLLTSMQATHWRVGMRSHLTGSLPLTIACTALPTSNDFIKLPFVTLEIDCRTRSYRKFAPTDFMSIAFRGGLPHTLYMTFAKWQQLMCMPPYVPMHTAHVRYGEYWLRVNYRFLTGHWQSAVYYRRRDTVTWHLGVRRDWRDFEDMRVTLPMMVERTIRTYIDEVVLDSSIPRCSLAQLLTETAR